MFISAAAETANIRLNEQSSAPEVELWLDRRKAMQVLVNLLANAIKFTPSGGIVSVALEMSADGRCVISVSDTGIGMSAAQIPIALEPFGQVETAYTRKHQGTGLGLPLSKRLVEAMGGRLVLSSQPNVGTRVELHFPPETIVNGTAGLAEPQDIQPDRLTG